MPPQDQQRHLCLTGGKVNAMMRSRRFCQKHGNIIGGANRAAQVCPMLFGHCRDDGCKPLAGLNLARGEHGARRCVAPDGQVQRNSNRRIADKGHLIDQRRLFIIFDVVARALKRIRGDIPQTICPRRCAAKVKIEKRIKAIGPRKIGLIKGRKHLGVVGLTVQRLGGPESR